MHCQRCAALHVHAYELGARAASAAAPLPTSAQGCPLPAMLLGHGTPGASGAVVTSGVTVTSGVAVTSGVIVTSGVAGVSVGRRALLGERVVGAGVSGVTASSAARRGARGREREEREQESGGVRVEAMSAHGRGDCHRVRARGLYGPSEDDARRSVIDGRRGCEVPSRGAHEGA